MLARAHPPKGLLRLRSSQGGSAALLACGKPGTGLIDLGAGHLHDLRPLGNFRVDQFGEFLWRVAAWDGALGQHFLFDRGGGQRFGHFLLDAADDFRWRARRREQSKPAAGLKALELAGLFYRGSIGQGS